jgi:hypothetical protein
MFRDSLQDLETFLNIKSFVGKILVSPSSAASVVMEIDSLGMPRATLTRPAVIAKRPTILAKIEDKSTVRDSIETSPSQRELVGNRNDSNVTLPVCMILMATKQIENNSSRMLGDARVNNENFCNINGGSLRDAEANGAIKFDIKSSDSVSLGILAAIASGRDASPNDGKSQLMASTKYSSQVSTNLESISSPSQRLKSDNSTESMHQAGTPKSRNLMSSSPDNKLKRNRQEITGPQIPLIGKVFCNASAQDHLCVPSLSSIPEEVDTTCNPEEREKNSRDSFTMERPTVLKCQRSHPEGYWSASNRPPSLIDRQRSTGSRLSFADEVNFGDHSSVSENTSDRRLNMPSTWKKGDRQFSMESFQPPRVIRAADRQFSIESTHSFRSHDSTMHTLTPTSRMTPSFLGNPSANSPNVDTPNTDRTADIYDQIDQHLENCMPQFSPDPKGMESTGQPFPKFQPTLSTHLKPNTGETSAMNFHNDTNPNFCGFTHNLPYPPFSKESNLNTPRKLPCDEVTSQHFGLDQRLMPNNQSYQHFGMAGRNKTYPNQQSSGCHTQQLNSQNMQRMNAADATNQPVAPLDPENLRLWLEGSDTNSFNSNEAFPVPIPPLQQSSNVAGRAFSHGAFTSGFNPYSGGFGFPSLDFRMCLQQSQQFQNNPSNGQGIHFSRTPSQGQYIQPFTRRAVEFGRPKKDLMEGSQSYSRQELLLKGAHKSDISAINGNSVQGCDSILYTTEARVGDITKDDLCFLQFHCSYHNGGGAVFFNYQMKHNVNAAHSFPIRVFRKIKLPSGAESFRYDGLYHVAAIFDDCGRPRAEPCDSKSFRFLLRRNPAGERGDQNQLTLDKLWDIIQQASFPSQKKQSMPWGGQSLPDDLPMPPFGDSSRSHTGRQNTSGGGTSRASGRPDLKRKSSAEVSLIHIRYFDDAHR